MKLFKPVLIPLIWLFVSAITMMAEKYSMPVYFNNISVNEGLPSNITTSIAMDNHGFIWIGTHDGLCRFDGKRFISFRHNNDDKSIESNQISALLNVGEEMWVGTWSGLSILNTKTFEIEQLDIGKGNAVRVLYKGSDFIWIGTANGLIKVNDRKEIVKIYNAKNSGLSHNTIRSLYQAGNGELWIGTYDKLNKLLNDSITVYDLKRNYKPLLKNNLVIAIKDVPHSLDTLLWVGTETGLCLFNTLTGHYKSYNENNSNLSNDVIKTIYTDQNNVWLGTDFGLNIYNTESNSFASFFHHPDQYFSIANNVVWDIYKDYSGVFWFVTSNGISYTKLSNNYISFNEISYNINNESVGNQVKDIVEDDFGNLWFATIHGLLMKSKKSGKESYFTSENKNNKRLLLNNVFTLAKDNLHRIWIGTAGGINVWDPKINKMYSITASENNGLTSNYISKIFQDKNGHIWVSAWEGGLFKGEGSINRPELLNFKKISNIGTDKYIYHNNSIWYTDNGHIFSIDVNTLEVKEFKLLNEIISNKTVECLMVSHDECLWIGAKDLLLKYNPINDNIENIPLIGNRNKTIIGIQEDFNHNIWMSTYNSIIYLPKDQKIPIFLPIADGIPLKSFYANCNTLNIDGTMLFGGENGYIEINPELFELPKINIPVFITHIDINNQPYSGNNKIYNGTVKPYPVSYMKKIELNSDHKSVMFEFSALDYSQPQENMYAYKLEGFDDDWQYTSGDRNFAVYANLPADHYILKVKGASSYGVWSKNEIELNVIVHPSIWLSKGFILLYFVLLITIAYVALRINTFRQKLLNEIKITKLENEHNEALIKTRQQFFTNVSHELKTPLNLILSPINQLLKQNSIDGKSYKLLNLAQKNTQRLLWLVNQILDFRKMEVGKITIQLQETELISFCQELFEMYQDYAERLGFIFKYRHNIDSYRTPIDKDKMSIVLFNLLSNAFKFAKEESTIILNCEIIMHPFDLDKISISVENEGEGIGNDEIEKIFERFYQSDTGHKGMGSGIGLTIAKEYVELHGGKLLVESVPNKTTTFKITLNSHHSTEHQYLPSSKREVEYMNRVTLEKKKDLDNVPLILVVDDNPDILSLVDITLNNLYNIETAVNGNDALKKIESRMPDLIISDVMMPGMDGITFCQNIRNSKITNHIPIILLTAKIQDENKIEGVQAGADIYITKPFDTTYLKVTIDRLLTRKKEMQSYISKLIITEPGVKGSTENNVDNVFLQKVMTIIENNINNDQLSVDYLSHEVGLSATHLYRKIKSITGHSPNELIKKYRVKTASIMLGNNEGNITEIMYSVGFTNLSYFSKCFKTEFGCTPKEYKANSN